MTALRMRCAVQPETAFTFVRSVAGTIDSNRVRPKSAVRAAPWQYGNVHVPFGAGTITPMAGCTGCKHRNVPTIRSDARRTTPQGTGARSRHLRQVQSDVATRWSPGKYSMS